MIITSEFSDNYQESINANVKHLMDLAADNGVTTEIMDEYPEVEEFICDVAQWLATNGISAVGGAA